MGMDVYGKKPTTKAGEYFRANCWSWRPIHELLCRGATRHLDLTGKPLLSEDEMFGMSYNDGCGVNEQERCDLLAGYLEELTASDFHLGEAGFAVNGDAIAFPVECGAVDRQGQFLSLVDVRSGKYPPEEVFPVYETNRQHVGEFVAFLRNCGGFEVW